MAAGKYVLKKAGDQFVFELVAGDGKIILASDRYETEADARDGIEAVRESSQIAARYQMKKSLAGYPYFVLEDADGKIIGASEVYSSESELENGIEVCRANGLALRLEKTLRAR